MCAGLCFSYFVRYLGFLMDLTRVKGIRNGKVISDQIQDVAVRVKAIRPMAADMATLLLEEGTLVAEVFRII